MAHLLCLNDENIDLIFSDFGITVSLMSIRNRLNKAAKNKTNTPPPKKKTPRININQQPNPHKKKTNKKNKQKIQKNPKNLTYISHL